MFLVNTFLLFKFLIFLCCFSHLENLGLLRRWLKIIRLSISCCLIFIFLLLLALTLAFTLFIHLFSSDSTGYGLASRFVKSVLAELILRLRLEVLGVVSGGLSARSVASILLAALTSAFFAAEGTLVFQGVAWVWKDILLVPWLLEPRTESEGSWLFVLPILLEPAAMFE